MTAAQISDLLDSAEMDLNGVSRSMLAPDALLSLQSQSTLERMVQNLTRVKEEALVSGSCWPPEIRIRLQSFGDRLRRVQSFGDAALSAVRLRSRLSGIASAGYAARGCPVPGPTLTTITLDC